MSVLLVRAGALGDVLLLRRTVCALRRAGHGVQLVAPASAGAVLVGAGESEIERLWPWDGPDVAKLLAGDTAGSALAESARGAEAVIAYTRSPAVIDALRALTTRLLAHDPAPPPDGPHASRWLAEPLRTLGIPSATDPPPIRFSGDEHAAAEPVLGRLPAGFVAIHPGSGSPAKNWPAERFVALAQRLAPDLAVLLALGPAEEEWAAGVGVQRLRGVRWVVTRGIPIRVLGAILARAGLFVGNDSGASHLAAAAGAPTLALFGPTDPSIWAPTGTVVRCLRAPGRQLDELAVDAVAAAARGLLPS